MIKEGLIIAVEEKHQKLIDFLKKMVLMKILKIIKPFFNELI